MTKTVTINVPAPTFLRADGESRVELDWARVPASVIPEILAGCAKVIMTNAYNSGGKDVAEKDRLANMKRRMEAWYRGEYALTATGPRESIIGEMKDEYVSDRVAEGKTVKQVEESIRSTVTAVFGKDEKATFGRFLDAVAALKTKADPTKRDEVRAELEAGLLAKVEASRKAKAEAEAESPVEITAEDLGF